MSYTFKYSNVVIGEETPTQANHSDLNLDDGTNPHGTTASDVDSYTKSETVDLIYINNLLQ